MMSPRGQLFPLVMPDTLIEHFGTLKAAQEAIAEAVKRLEEKAHQEAAKSGYRFRGRFPSPHSSDA